MVAEDAEDAEGVADHAWIPGQASLEDRESRFHAMPCPRCVAAFPRSLRGRVHGQKPARRDGLTDWRERREWVTKDGQPDVVAMSELFWDAKVLVVDCDEEIDTDLKRREMPFREFARWWRSSATGKRASAGADARAKLYVKDWNFVRDFSAYRAYDTPPHVRDDWLNSSWSNEDDALCSSARGGATTKNQERGRKATKEKDENDPDRLDPGRTGPCTAALRARGRPCTSTSRARFRGPSTCGRKSG